MTSFNSPPVIDVSKLPSDTLRLLAYFRYAPAQHLLAGTDFEEIPIPKSAFEGNLGVWGDVENKFGLEVESRAALAIAKHFADFGEFLGDVTGKRPHACVAAALDDIEQWCNSRRIPEAWKKFKGRTIPMKQFKSTKWWRRYLAYCELLVGHMLCYGFPRSGILEDTAYDAFLLIGDALEYQESETDTVTMSDGLRRLFRIEGSMPSELRMPFEDRAELLITIMREAIVAWCASPRKVSTTPKLSE